MYPGIGAMDRNADTVADEHLVVLARAGSREALTLLVRRWTPRLTRHAVRSLGDRDLAMDAVQDAWFAAVRDLGRLDDPQRLPAWLYAIVTRRCIDVIRAAVRGRRLRAGLKSQPGAATTDAAARATELALDFASALRALPADQRLVASLFYGEGLDLEAVADVLGVPEGTVKSRLHHARKALQRHVKGAEHD